jgi:peptidoglycan lytic transglycosylase G
MTGAGTHGRAKPRWRRVVLRASVALCVGALPAACGGPAPNAPREEFLIPKRATLRAVADTLAAHHVITSPRRFVLIAHLYGVLLPAYRGLDRHLRPGRYQFPRGARTRTILDDMLKGRTKDDFFTVPEGYDITQIAGAAHQKLGMDSAAFVAATRDSALRRALDLPERDHSLEGYLFPDTYRVVFGASAAQLVHQMVQRFQAVWDTAWDARARQMSLTRNQVMTLASIVEAEALLPSERRTIAGVYWNRLQRRHPMRLQADPTVIYALGHHVNRVLLRDLKVQSPYNTYLHEGLPPGPICSPGRASILAALWPEQNGFLFFVARPDGSHMFSVTAAQQADSVRVARRLRADVEAAQRDSVRAARRESTAVRRARADSVARLARGDSAAATPAHRDSGAAAVRRDSSARAPERP